MDSNTTSMNCALVLERPDESQKGEQAIGFWHSNATRLLLYWLDQSVFVYSFPGPTSFPCLCGENFMADRKKLAGSLWNDKEYLDIFPAHGRTIFGHRLERYT